MKPFHRFVLHAVLPPFFGGLLAALWMIATSEFDPLEGVLSALFLITVVYIAGIVPSTAYAATMEWAFRHRLQPGRIGAVTLSACLGALVGSIPLIGELLTNRRTSLGQEALVSATIGLIVGVGVEILVAKIVK